MKGKVFPKWNYNGKDVFDENDLSDMERKLWNEVKENKQYTADGLLTYKKVNGILYITGFYPDEKPPRRNKPRKKD